MAYYWELEPRPPLPTKRTERGIHIMGLSGNTAASLNSTVLNRILGCLGENLVCVYPLSINNCLKQYNLKSIPLVMKLKIPQL